MAFGKKIENVEVEVTKESGFTERVWFPADNAKKKTEVELIFLKTSFTDKDAMAVHSVPNINGYSKVLCDRGLRQYIAKYDSEFVKTGQVAYHYNKGTTSNPKTCNLCDAFESSTADRKAGKTGDTLARRGVETYVPVKVLSITEVNKETGEIVTTDFEEELIGVVGMSVLDAFFPQMKGLGKSLADYENEIDKKDKVSKLVNHTFKYSAGKLIHNDKLDKSVIEELKQYRDNDNFLVETFPHLMPMSYKQWFKDTNGVVRSAGKPAQQEPSPMSEEDDEKFDLESQDLNQPLF